MAKPQRVSTYFKNSNAIVKENQSRQYDLRLEKQWIIVDGYFRLVIIVLGITTTNA